MKREVKLSIEERRGGITVGALKEFMSALVDAPDDAKVELHTYPSGPVDPGTDRLSVRYEP